MGWGKWGGLCSFRYSAAWCRRAARRVADVPRWHRRTFFLNFVELDSARDFGLESSDSVDDTVHAHDEQYAVTYVPTVAINAKLSYCSSQRMVPFRSSVGFCT